MPIKNIQFFIIVSIITLNISTSNAQHHIGFSGGYSAGSFTNFTKKEGYDAIYHLKSGVSLSSFYEKKIDSSGSLKIELQYKWQNADMEVENNAGHASFYKKSDYSFHLLAFNLIYSFRLVEKKSFKLYFLLGPTFIYNINTAAKGNGWEYYSKEQIDTSGNTVYNLDIRHYEQNERHSKDLSGFNIGIDLGVEFILPINSNMDLLIQNRYDFFFISFIKQHDFRYTSLFTGHLNIGIRYNFRK
ncbi:hypothetical protein LJC68_06315 [Bacteroidales bacterium OttesenSCG-928-B11]|nr:hypothetical protein [Bacteroidales bacterium OttesenSCG-928-C03]MDL2312474.1 hypothetical protein [Bacteroidales bacterium OttesenSCG-928-B11]MDL2326539.1 hypothetical protein [Bacteroidales bacterium OttesenSCG-928-A14]